MAKPLFSWPTNTNSLDHRPESLWKDDTSWDVKHDEGTGCVPGVQDISAYEGLHNGITFTFYRKPAHSVKFPHRSLLPGADAPGGNGRKKVILAAHGEAGHPAQQGDLADVCESVGDGTLEEFFGGKAERPSGGEAPVELPELGEEARHLFLPGQRLRVVPDVPAVGEQDAPFEQVADVGQDLSRGARGGRSAEFRDAGGRATQHLAAPIGKRGEGVTQQ